MKNNQNYRDKDESKDDVRSSGFLSHLFSIIALPLMVIIVVPYLIHNNVSMSCCDFLGYFGETTRIIASTIFFLLGISLFLVTNYQFAFQGKGTLAPWDPPKSFVATGIYRYVRNPMILGVNLILVSIGIFYIDENILLWSAFFIAVSTIYFINSEEPDLEKRFGDSYRQYRKNVPMWIPRLKPWIVDS